MRWGSVGTPVGIVVAAVLAVLGTAGASAAEGEPDYGLSVDRSYLTGDVGGTATLRPEVFITRPDGSRADVPEGASVGAGRVIEYELPWNTSPVGLEEHKGCRVVKRAETPRQPTVRCDTVTTLTIRMDKGHTADLGTVRFVPDSRPAEGSQVDDDRATFLVTAPAPQEEGESAASLDRREGVGFKLLGVAGGFGVLAVFLLVRGRARRTGWASVVVGAVCAGLGAWSITQGPLTRDRTFVTYTAGPAQLSGGREGGTIWDTGRVVEKDRPAYVPTIATAPDPGNERVTEVPSTFYSAKAAGVPPELWLTLDGAWGRIDDPRRARDHMLKTAAAAPGAKVTQKPQLIVLKGRFEKDKPTLFKCQELSLPELPAPDRTVSMCAWADSGVRALVTVADDYLPSAAGEAARLRNTVQLGEYWS
ncbi:hypothetical protein ABZX85_41260 [Streptomyces sp. NPDC004539]|uniref:hypothetical protein n=1 Tax=Streptomyces sp. NPDC004539 TaxID=3154280 RepID=UPI0033B1EEF2